MRAATALVGIPAESVREVMRLPELRPLPSEFAAVLGAAIIRGSAVSVLDLRILLGLDQAATPSRLISLHVGTRRIALATDAVVGIARLDDGLAPAHPLATDAVGRLTVRDHELVLILETLRAVPEAAWQPLEIG
ncbi:MAG: chemotaxis protein CheW [Planctomycetes bacterium]|nr:chemotaxis protein CheW [Planctomycetota bacterium]